jgi:hypothetical protein
MTPIRARAVALLALLAVTGIYLATMATEIVVNDVTSTALASWRIAETGAPWLEGYDHTQHERTMGLWIGEAANGHVVAFRSPGPIALGIPAYAVAALAGVSGFSLVPGSVTAVVLTVAAMALLLGALTPHVGEKRALLAVAAVALTTPVWTVSADSLWTHPVTILGIAGMARAAQREQWWLVGLFGSVALWGRLHVALVVAVVGLGVAWSRRDPGVAVKVGLVSSVGLALSFLWGRWMYGTWSRPLDFPRPRCPRLDARRRAAAPRPDPQLAQLARLEPVAAPRGRGLRPRAGAAQRVHGRLGVLRLPADARAAAVRRPRPGPRGP